MKFAVVLLGAISIGLISNQLVFDYELKHLLIIQEDIGEAIHNQLLIDTWLIAKARGIK